MSLNDAPHIEAHGMLAQLPASVCAVIDALEKRGFEAWVVGGFVGAAPRGGGRACMVSRAHARAAVCFGAPRAHAAPTIHPASG